MDNKLFGIDREFMDNNFKSEYCERFSKDLFKILETKKPYLLNSGYSNAYPVFFVLSVVSISPDRSKIREAINDDTGRNYFVMRPLGLIANTIYENTCVVSKNFIDTYRKNGVPDFQIYPSTNLTVHGVLIDPNSNELYVDARLLIQSKIEDAFNCRFEDISDYTLPIDYLLQKCVNDELSKIGG